MAFDWDAGAVTALGAVAIIVSVVRNRAKPSGRYAIPFLLTAVGMLLTALEYVPGGR